MAARKTIEIGTFVAEKDAAGGFLLILPCGSVSHFASTCAVKKFIDNFVRLRMQEAHAEVAMHKVTWQ